MTGNGTLYAADGRKIYEGEWKNGLYHGRGTLYNLNPKQIDNSYDIKIFNIEEKTWLKYEGDFVEEKWNGIGKLYFTNGDMFYGEFKNNMLNGKGTFYKLEYTTLTGVWKENCLVEIY